MFDVTQSEIWKDCEVTADQHDNTLGWVEEKVSILYKWKPCKVNIRPYNTVILKLFMSNMSLQFFTGAYAMLTYLFLTELEVSTQEAISYIHMGHSNIDVLHVPTGLAMNRTKLLMSLPILEKLHPYDKDLILLTNMKIKQIICIHCA